MSKNSKGINSNSSYTAVHLILNHFNLKHNKQFYFCFWKHLCILTLVDDRKIGIDVDSIVGNAIVLNINSRLFMPKTSQKHQIHSAEQLINSLI